MGWKHKFPAVTVDSHSFILILYEENPRFQTFTISTGFPVSWQGPNYISASQTFLIGQELGLAKVRQFGKELMLVKYVHRLPSKWTRQSDRKLLKKICVKLM